tara:strand:+ start:266 stop:433 length:168 start_codon:yes stop_codon:yes gene_type:complete
VLAALLALMGLRAPQVRPDLTALLALLASALQVQPGQLVLAQQALPELPERLALV